MNEKQLRERMIQNIINLMNEENTPASSMRKMSNGMGASNNYMQTILSGSSYPSFKKITDIANYFDVDPSVLFNPNQRYGTSRDSLHNLIDSCPEDICPLLQDIILTVLKHTKDQ